MSVGSGKHPLHRDGSAAVNYLNIARMTVRVDSSQALPVFG